MTLMEKLRRDFHRQICQDVLHINTDGIPNNADKHSSISVALAKGIVAHMSHKPIQTSSPGQTTGSLFEHATSRFLEKAVNALQHLRPGKWRFEVNQRIESYEQYEHLADLSLALRKHKELRATLGDYLIKPDIVISREPVSDEEINRPRSTVQSSVVAQLTPLRLVNSQTPILHASISCKWTIRSDRSQNARTEELNLIRNRKGNTPHIAIVTAEPYPQRIASLALGTGDIDCVYHIALPELQAAVMNYDNPAALEMMDILVSGKRLRDISDLPFDLAI